MSIAYSAITLHDALLDWADQQPTVDSCEPDSLYPDRTNQDDRDLDRWLDHHDTNDLRVRVAEALERDTYKQFGGTVLREHIAAFVEALGPFEVCMYAVQHGLIHTTSDRPWEGWAAENPEKD